MHFYTLYLDIYGLMHLSLVAHISQYLLLVLYGILVAILIQTERVLSQEVCGGF
jgi:hypothetical protein